MGQAIAGMALAAFLCSPGNAQSATDARPAEAKPQFEVASIKPSVLPGRGAIRLGMRGGPGSADEATSQGHAAESAGGAL